MTVLILTVGTGTKGDHSNLAQGLVNSINQLAPRLYWLVSSAHPASIAVAELVRDGASPQSIFRPWASTVDFRQIQRPDDLFDCRSAIREVIQRARAELTRDDRLLVNPTSGTKQMSVAATLAALDEEVGEIVFTVGDRADGVVVTGTERMAPFETRRFFLERDLAKAAELFHAGAFFAAARLLKNHEGTEALHARERARCFHEWLRMKYAQAARHAARCPGKLARHLEILSKCDPLSLEVLGDLLAGADELLRWGDSEEALARYYRGAEHLAKFRLSQTMNLRPPYRLEVLLDQLPASGLLISELRSRARAGVLHLGNDLAWRILEAQQDPLAAAFRLNSRLQEGLRLRNDSLYGHGQEPVDVATVQRVADHLRILLREHLPDALEHWTAASRLHTSC